MHKVEYRLVSVSTAPKQQLSDGIATSTEAESLEDDGPSGYPTTSINEETVKAVEKLVMDDHRITFTNFNFPQHLAVSCMITSKWANAAPGGCHVFWPLRCIRIIWSTPMRPFSNVMRLEMRLLTILLLETRSEFTTIIHWHAETKEWWHIDSPLTRRPRTIASAGKIMLTVFWDAQGVLLADTIVGWLREKIKHERRGKLSCGILLLHDNAPVHRAAVAQAALHNRGFVDVNQPSYSPDIAPSDFFISQSEEGPSWLPLWR